MNGEQARLLLDGAYEFAQYVPNDKKTLEKLDKAYNTIKKIIEMGNGKELVTDFEPDTNIWDWKLYYELTTEGASQ